MADLRTTGLRAALAATALLTAVAATSADAGAATVTMAASNGTVQVKYVGSDAERNQLAITGSRTSVTLTDPGATITPAGGCTAAGDGSVTCEPTAPAVLTSLNVTVAGTPGGAQSITDEVTGFATVSPLATDGIVLQLDGPGTITGGPSAEVIAVTGGASGTGGGGDDIAQVGAGGGFAGGDGNDSAILIGGESFDGGPGSDGVVALKRGTNGQTFDPQPVTFRLDANAATTGNGFPGQNVLLSNVENAYGGPLDDTLVGSSATNVLAGFGGSDTIDGGAGSDDLHGGAVYDTLGSFLTQLTVFNQLPPSADGANLFRAVDGQTDLIDCTGGAAQTIVTADTIDVLTDCDTGPRTTLVTPPPPVPAVQQVPGEQVPAPFTVPRPLDRTKPKATKVKVPVLAGKALRKRGRYTVAFTPSEAVTAQVDLTAAGRVASIARAGDLVLASTTVKATARKRKTVRVTVVKRLRRLLKAKRRVTVTLKLTDPAGNVTRVTRKLRVRG